MDQENQVPAAAAADSAGPSTAVTSTANDSPIAGSSTAVTYVVTKPPVLKRGKGVDNGAVAKMKKKAKLSFPYNMLTLLNAFGKRHLDNVQVNYNYTKKGGLHLPQFTFQYLKNNFILKLNFNGNLTHSCFLTSNGALAIFNPCNVDIDILNNLLAFLMTKLNVNSSTHVGMELEKGETMFLRADRLTTCWDKDGKLLTSLPKNAFQAKIAVKVMGVMFRDCSENDTASTTTTTATKCMMLTHLEQVQVVEVDRPDDGAIAKCLFD